jgi:hypothetical protein
MFRRLTLAAVALALSAAFAACSSAGAGSSAAVSTIPPVLQSAAASFAAGGGSAAVCRDLTNLKTLDNAFGASFSVIQNLDASSKAQTLKDLQAFQAEAPAELQSSVTSLTEFWTALSTDPSSVTETDPRFVTAAQTIAAWAAANCA